MTHTSTIPPFNCDGLTVYGGAARKSDEPKEPQRIGGMTDDPRHTRQVSKRHAVRLMREDNAARHIGALPAEGEDVVLILTGNWHGFDMLAAIMELAGEGVTVTDAYIATLGFNRFQTDTLAAMLDDGRIGRLCFVVSHMFTEKNAAEYQYLADTLTTRGQVIANTRNHAKLMLLRLSDGRHIITHGSLNLRRCNSFEQCVISNDRDLFRFFADFLDDVVAGEVEA